MDSNNIMFYCIYDLPRRCYLYLRYGHHFQGCVPQVNNISILYPTFSYCKFSITFRDFDPVHFQQSRSFLISYTSTYSNLATSIIGLVSGIIYFKTKYNDVNCNEITVSIFTYNKIKYKYNKNMEMMYVELKKFKQELVAMRSSVLSFFFQHST